jgi:hypothetical protein
LLNRNICKYPSVAIDIRKKKHIGRKRYGKRDDFEIFSKITKLSIVAMRRNTPNRIKKTVEKSIENINKTI